jgi:hypothetical protein
VFTARGLGVAVKEVILIRWRDATRPTITEVHFFC